MFHADIAVAVADARFDAAFHRAAVASGFGVTEGVSADVDAYYRSVRPAETCSTTRSRRASKPADLARPIDDSMARRP